uniref:Uncharacterized protein n=1 Tax=Cacopsylla melanoneura TaxID=428564 RepID=A0A8D8LCB6_9HEMI
MSIVVWLPVLMIILLVVGGAIIYMLWKTRCEQFFAIDKSATLKNDFYETELFNMSTYTKDTSNNGKEYPRSVEDIRMVWCYDGYVRTAADVMRGAETRISSLSDVYQLWWNMRRNNAFAICNDF